MYSEVISFQHATTVFTQPALRGSPSKPLYFSSLDTQVSAFCSLVSRPHPPRCIFAVCTPFSFNFDFRKKIKKKKKKSLVAWSLLCNL